MLVSTGQHRDLLHVALAAFDLAADHDLAIMRRAQGPADVVGELIPALTALFDIARPRAVIVQGDTATTLAGALAGAYARLPVVHVEAGLRSGHADPFPEEMHRRQVAQIATLHCAPTVGAAAALHREGIDPSTVHLTGNSGIDALRWIEARLDRDAALSAGLTARFAAIDWARPLIIVTAHRRENHGEPLAAIAAALVELAREAEIAIPVHPHPAVAGPLTAALGRTSGIHLLPPLDYPAFVWLLRRASLALTDSGGVQEEAPAVGTPVLVLRDATERSEGIASGNARLIGTRTAAIVAAARGLLADTPSLRRMAEPATPYGSGDAAGRIADAVLARFGRPALAVAAE